MPTVPLLSQEELPEGSGDVLREIEHVRHARSPRGQLAHELVEAAHARRIVRVLDAPPTSRAVDARAREPHHERSLRRQQVHGREQSPAEVVVVDRVADVDPIVPAREAPVGDLPDSRQHDRDVRAYLRDVRRPAHRPPTGARA